ncbi:MAG TPA: hypothetical protein VIK75_10140 [Calditerricola sp.]
MTKLYEVRYYAPDGHGTPADDTVITVGTLEECRREIRDMIGAYYDDPGCKWDGLDGDVEAYHESAEEGCGGYAIRPVSDDDL